MKITKLKWANAQRDSLKVTLDDGKEVFAPWPCETWHREYVQAFMDANPVEAEDPPTAPIDFSDVDNLEKGLKALGLVVAEWTGKTPAELKAAFKAKWRQLP